jgi:UDP-N-acetylmuramoylalanine-D-glutamate ligase
VAELSGKRMLLIGLGGTGEQIARRASAFGLRIAALDDVTTDRPEGVGRPGTSEQVGRTVTECRCGNSGDAVDDEDAGTDRRETTGGDEDQRHVDQRSAYAFD